MRKQFLLTSALILLTFIAFAQQSNLIFYTEKGENFFIFINGVKQNKDAKNNVKVTNLSNTSCKCKIVFSNTKFGKIDKVIELKAGMESNYAIKKVKNQWQVNWVNDIEIQNNQIQKPVPINVNLQPIPIDNNSNTNNNSTYNDGNNNKIENTSGYQQRHTKTHNNEGTQTTTTTTTTQTVVTTNGSQNYNNQNNTYNNRNTQNKTRHNEKDKHHAKETVYEPVPGYTGVIGCNNPMGESNFLTAKQSIASKTFEESKLTIAKQIINNNCLLTSQVKEIILLFDFESTKLDFAKYAYGYTYDIGNYYMINDAFQFESSIDELNKYITKK